MYHSLLHEDMKKFFEGYPAHAHPMTVLSAMVASLGTFYPNDDDDSTLRLNAIRLIAKIKTIAAFSHKKAIGQPFIYPTNGLSYCADFLKMMFAVPSEDFEVSPLVEHALDQLLILHADHEQNCSTSTVRMVGSSGADLFSSISAGISALSGPLHGRANQEVLEMLAAIQRDGGDYAKYIEKAKDKDDPFRLMGFGHRVYKNFDPRARVIKKAASQVLEKLGVDDPLLDIAQNLERVALADEYFIERRLYPNVDFYSGILYRAMRIPQDMFTVMFALGRLPWVDCAVARDEGRRGHADPPATPGVHWRDASFVRPDRRPMKRFPPICALSVTSTGAPAGMVLSEPRSSSSSTCSSSFCC